MMRNIKIDYVYRFLSSFDITAGIWVLFLAYKGMSLVQIGLLESIFHLCSLIFEVPTGALADLLGRKKVMILSRIASLISCVLMLISNSFLGFAVGFIFSAFGYNLNSGSEEALVYDSLIAVNKEDQYLRFNSRLNVIIEIAQALAVFIGGLLAEVSFNLSYSLAILVAISSFSIALQFQEPPMKKMDHDQKITTHFLKSWSLLKSNRQLLGWVIYFPMMMTFATIIYFYAQQYFFDLGYSKVVISFIFLMNGIASSGGALMSDRLEKRLKDRVWWLIPLGMGISIVLFGIGESLVSLVMFFVLNFFNASLYPISSLYINELIPSNQRATLISLSSMVFSLMMIILFPICGLIGELISLPKAFISIGMMNLILIACTFMFKKLVNVQS